MPRPSFRHNIYRPGLHSIHASVGSPALAIGLLALVLGLVMALSVQPARPARAQGGGGSLITHTTVTDFVGASCGVVNNAIVSSAAGGEVRLAATVEDYFDDTEIDTTLWLTGTVYEEWYSIPPVEAGGVVTFDSSYLRSQTGFNASTPVRFFEARARQRLDSRPAGWPDLGFYREYPPLYYGEDGPYPDDSSLRLFVTSDLNATYARARDGDESAPLIDIAIDTPDLQQYHVFRIDWFSTSTDYYVDSNLEATADDGTSDLNAWVYLYHQTPSGTHGTSPMEVDWVRAGVYPGSGTFISCPQDAGQVANWEELTLVSDQPAGTTVGVSTRTSSDGVTWSGWQAVSGNTIASPNERYLQYRLELGTSDVLASPEVQEVEISYRQGGLVVTPGQAELDPGGSRQFTAQVYDIDGNPVGGLSYNWQVVNGGGTINGSGLFTAGSAAGTYQNTVRASATYNGETVRGEATVVVRNLPPVADAGGPYVGVEGQVVNLSGSGSDPNGGSVSLAWDLDGDGLYDDGTGSNPSYSWPDNGSYTVGLEVRDGGGLTDTDTAQVTIGNVAPVINAVNVSGGVQVGQQVTVAVTATDVAADVLSYSFDWDNNGVYEIVDQASNTASTSYSQSGVHTIGVRVRDDDGGQDTDTVQVTIASLVVTPGQAELDPGGSQQFTAQVYVGANPVGGLSYSWQVVNGGGTINGSGLFTAGSVAGMYQNTVRASATYNGETVTGEATVVVRNAPPVADAGGPYAGVEGQMVNLGGSGSDPNGGSVTLAWDLDGDGLYDDGTGTNPSYSWPDNGTYTVGLEVQADGGLTDTDTTQVMVVNVAPVINAVNAVGTGQQVTVVVAATDVAADVLSYSFDWDNNGVYEIVDQASNTASTSYSQGGTHTIGVRVRDDDGGQDTETTTVTVEEQASVYLPITIK